MYSYIDILVIFLHSKIPLPHNNFILNILKTCHNAVHSSNTETFKFFLLRNVYGYFAYIYVCVPHVCGA